MSYDLEKYRDKRERVLGVKKRGMGFGAWAVLISVTMLLGLCSAVVPESVVYFTTRNLDDVIYKRHGEKNWPQEFVGRITVLKGVKQAVADTGGTRLVVTFDRSETDTPAISTFISGKGFKALMLNRVSHYQRLTTLKEDAELEAL